MIGAKRIQPLAGSQKRGLAKAAASGSTESYLAKHPGVAKHQEKVQARTDRRAAKLEATKRPAEVTGGTIGGNVPQPNLPPARQGGTPR